MKVAPRQTDDASIVGPLSLRLPEPLSDDTLLWLSAHNESLSFEQSAEGELIVTPPTGSLGNRGELRLITQMMNWNDRTGFGEIRGLTGGVLLPQGGQYQADTFVISREAWNQVPIEDRDKGFPPVLPAAAFELLSPANLTATGYETEFAKKLDAYKRSSIPLVVLLHPQTESASNWRPGREEETTTALLLTFPELPGLELDAGLIYAAVNNP
jgi:Uma2 family endonuclease